MLKCWLEEHKSEISTFGKYEEQEAGQATGVGRELVGLQTSGVGRSREVEGKTTGEGDFEFKVARSRDSGSEGLHDAEARVSKEGKDGITGGSD